MSSNPLGVRDRVQKKHTTAQKSEGLKYQSGNNVPSASGASNDEVCSICSQNANTTSIGTVTSECSHWFHLSCICRTFRPGNHLCPVCGFIWKDLPFQFPNRIYQIASSLWPEPQHFSDDEPLFTANGNKSSIRSHYFLTLKSSPEVPAIPASDSNSKFAVLAGVRAVPLLNLDDDHSRHRRLGHAPIDLVLVLDVSCSMIGAKIALLKRAVEFVIQNLGSSDRLSIIAFSRDAKRILPLRRMSDIGHKDASLAASYLTIVGGTDIVGGLKKGVRVLEGRTGRNPVASIMLLSDGQDSKGHSHLNINQSLPASICPRSGKATIYPVHTFGFGLDHDSAMLNAISDASGGTFSFIKSIDMVQEAFARCVGGLLSVVAQQVQLGMTTISPGIRIGSITSGRHFNQNSEHGQQGTIDIEDLYADEEKEFLVYLSIPAATSQEKMEEKTLLLDVTCSYIDPVSNEMVQVKGMRVQIRRPEHLCPWDAVMSMEVDRQKNRVWVAEGIAEAKVKIEMEDVKGAQDVLDKHRSTLLSSASAQARDGLCSQLGSGTD
ncbi:hypothetical protein RJ639_045310 [Escallonia herrerae]|uniref:Uncharacterized protein n=1 Tax=Escallonia herrerae TaxID=1293975 RepID=A0AA88W9B7_9ASTE|nr:hypothetical protein RJ639_045310 [Escallonia herrerae]